MSQPRAELYAALLNAHTGEIVRKSFKKWHQSSIKLSDSQIVLYWLSNDAKPLKQWVRNRVIDILRFTKIEDWYYIRSENMIADLGTRRGATLKDVNNESSWFNGYDWMTQEPSEMPIQMVSQINMSVDDNQEIQEIQSVRNVNNAYQQTDQQTHKIAEEVKKRLEFSQYLINPNRFRFNTVVRIMAIVIKFCQLLKNKKIQGNTSDITRPPQIILTESELQSARNHFWKKATLEVKHFNPKVMVYSITLKGYWILTMCQSLESLIK